MTIHYDIEDIDRRCNISDQITKCRETQESGFDFIYKLVTLGFIMFTSGRIFAIELNAAKITLHTSSHN